MTKKSVEEYCAEIAWLWPKPGQSPTRAILDACLQAVGEHPESSVLWCDLGTIMGRWDADSGFTAADYLRCYENAVKFDPNNAEAFQELGYVLDVYFSDYNGAERAFKRAIELGAEHESYLGRARALAQMGRTDDAINILAENACPFHHHPEIQKLRSEIFDGSWFSPER